MRLQNIVVNALTVIGFAVNVIAKEATTCTAAVQTPVPKKKFCGSTGTLGSPDIIRSPVTTFSGCRDTCVLPRNERCVSFEYNNNTSVCNILGQTLQNQDYDLSEKQPGVLHYNKRCFFRDCRCKIPEVPTADHPPSEVVNDGSFEARDTPWRTNGGAMITRECNEENHPYDGSAFACLVALSGGLPNISQNNGFKTNQPYRLRYQYRVRKANGNCFLSVRMNQQEVSRATFTDAVPDWTLIETGVLVITHDNSQLMQFSASCAEMRSTTAVDIDAVSLVPADNS